MRSHSHKKMYAYPCSLIASAWTVACREASGHNRTRVDSSFLDGTGTPSIYKRQVNTSEKVLHVGARKIMFMCVTLYIFCIYERRVIAWCPVCVSQDILEVWSVGEQVEGVRKCAHVMQWECVSRARGEAKGKGERARRGEGEGREGSGWSIYGARCALVNVSL